LSSEVKLSLTALIVAVVFMAVSCTKQPNATLPMPGQSKQWIAFNDHYQSCEICNAEDPNGGPGALCQRAFDLMAEAMESDSDLWKASPRDGYEYIGPPINGWQWSTRRQEWVKQ
jgi:hypothetical protein